MRELSKSQKARIAIRTFKTLADAMILQGSYVPSSRMGEKLCEALKQLSPEIYGSMTDPRIVELKGLEYVIDRMPRGIERCNRIILTAQEDFHDTSFEKIIPLKRRRVSYAVSPTEMCFVITRGQSEIYDILTHITFLTIEAEKIYHQAIGVDDEVSPEWRELERILVEKKLLTGEELDRAIWSLSILLGRTYGETKETYEYLEKSHTEENGNSGLFQIVYAIGKRLMNERRKKQDELSLSFTPALHEVIGQHKYGTIWAQNLKEKLYHLGFHQRPIHIISANTHSVKNILYAAGMLQEEGVEVAEDLYEMIRSLRNSHKDCSEYAARFGLFEIDDASGSNIDVQIIDTALLTKQTIHPEIQCDFAAIAEQQPVLVVMDYAFGTQAFEVMDELLSPCQLADRVVSFVFESVSVMGKAGILPGSKGDIMLATAHVMEGTPDNYLVQNDLKVGDFDAGVDVYCGPIVTVLGTSLQNRDVLERFHSSSWRAVGLEMEGGHYQRAISAAIIRGHIPHTIKTRYAYYASDNPLISGQTLASGPMGEEGIVPTYMISKVIIEKILTCQQG